MHYIGARQGFEVFSLSDTVSDGATFRQVVLTGSVSHDLWI